MFEHLTNCHGEWTAFFALVSSIPFAGAWYRTKIEKLREEDENR